MNERRCFSVMRSQHDGSECQLVAHSIRAGKIDQLQHAKGSFVNNIGINLKRILLSIIGLASLGVGIIGIWVPGLPTTIFVLIALWCLGQSNPRLQRRLYEIRWLKPVLVEADLFRIHRAVRFRSKIVAQSCAWGMGIGTILLTGPGPLWVVVLVAALSCSAFMVWIPTYVPADQNQPIGE